MKTTDKFLSTVVLTAAALCASCSTDDLAAQQQEQTETKTVSLTATLNENLTRAGMSKGTIDNTAKFYWHNKDALFVQTQTADGTSYFGTIFRTADKTGETTATFLGDVASGATLGTYAVYPYNEKHQFTTATALTYNLPASYTYTTVDTGIFSKTDSEGNTTYRTNSTNIPMFGKISNGTVSFNYLGGLAVIRIDKMPVAAGTLTVTADQQLCGDFTVEDLSASDAQIKTTTASDGNGKVTFTFSGATADGVGVFYLPLAIGDYTHVKFEIKDQNTNTWWTYSCSGTLSIARAGGTAVSLSAANMGCIKKNDDGTYTVNGHKFIDLGLSVLWAETNIGATKASDYGDYFAWGETTAKTDFSGTCAALSKYTTGGATLESSDDAATANWGEGARIPTEAEISELTGCNGTWTTSNSVYGCQVTGKGDYTSNSIFLPAAGCYFGTKLSETGLSGRCFYWGSEISSSNTVLCLGFNYNMSQKDALYNPSGYGLPVRAVAEKPITTD